MEVSVANHPILLIVNSSAANKYGVYLGEILRAEGHNAVEQVELSRLTLAKLNQHELAILAETPLNSYQAATLTTYVSGGGALLGRCGLTRRLRSAAAGGQRHQQTTSRCTMNAWSRTSIAPGTLASR